MSDYLPRKDSYFTHLYVCGEDQLKCSSPSDSQENSSSIKSTGSGSKKRKWRVKEKEKEQIRRRSQGTLSVGESSTSKQPGKPTKKAENYEECIKSKSVGESAKILIDRLNRRKTSANDIQNQLRSTYKKLDKSSPLRAKLEKHVEDLKEMKDEIEGIKKDISSIRDLNKKREITDVDAKKEFIKIEKEKLPKFLEDVEKARKGLSEGLKEAKNEIIELKEMGEDLQNMKDGWVEMHKGIAIIRKVLNKTLKVKEKADNLVECITNNEEYLLKDRFKELSSEVLHLQKENAACLKYLIPQTWNQVACGQRIQSLVEWIQSLDEQQIQTLYEQIQAGGDQDDVLVVMRGYQHALGQQLQILDEQQIQAGGDQGDELVEIHGYQHALGQQRQILDEQIEAGGDQGDALVEMRGYQQRQILDEQQIQSLDEQIQSLDEQIQSLDKQIQDGRDQRDVFVEMRGYQVQHALGQQRQNFDEQQITELNRQIRGFVADRDVLVERRAILRVQAEARELEILLEEV